MTRFKVVAGSSSVETEVRSSLHPIHGKATELTGEIEGDFDGAGPRLDQPYHAWVEVPVEAIKSGNRLTEIEMQRRADVRRFPTIRFEVERVWQEDGAGDRYRAAVNVTAHGRTQSFEEDFRLRHDGRRLVLDGQHTFDMRDFGVDPPRLLTLKVDPQVRVSVRLVADQED